MATWLEHVEHWKDCQACPLGKQRVNICLARGTVPCDVLFIGEAPGASEDALGQPFVGPAGQLLDQVIEQSLPQELTYALTNLVCCFPREAKSRGDNEPERSEILACRPRLTEFVNIAQPRLIVCVGNLAAEYVDHHDSVACHDIIHPAAILRMPLAQRQMATQRVIVSLRCAVEDNLQADLPEFKEWGNRGTTRGQELRQRLDAWLGSEEDIPF